MATFPKQSSKAITYSLRSYKALELYKAIGRIANINARLLHFSLREARLSGEMGQIQGYLLGQRQNTHGKYSVGSMRSFKMFNKPGSLRARKNCSLGLQIWRSMNREKKKKQVSDVSLPGVCPVP